MKELYLFMILEQILPKTPEENLADPSCCDLGEECPFSCFTLFNPPCNFSEKLKLSAMIASFEFSLSKLNSFALFGLRGTENSKFTTSEATFWNLHAFAPSCEGFPCDDPPSLTFGVAKGDWNLFDKVGVACAPLWVPTTIL
jgi:hypothetical protein